MTKEQKDWIDNASYEDLLRRWRHAPLGDAFFSGECGDYYKAVFNKKRSETTDGERVAASKRIGW
jgi:hypothetical protein